MTTNHTYALAYCAENRDVAKEIDRQLSRAGLSLSHIVCEQFSGNGSFYKRLHSDGLPIIMLYSDNFFKTEACMHRANQLLQENIANHQFIPIITDGKQAKDDGSGFLYTPTLFHKISNVIHYMNHWQDIYLDIRKKRRQIPPSEESIYKIKVEKIKAISSEMGEFLRLLRDIDYYQYADLKANNFEALYKRIGISVDDTLLVENDIPAANPQNSIDNISPDNGTERVPEISASSTNGIKVNVPNNLVDKLPMQKKAAAEMNIAERTDYLAQMPVNIPPTPSVQKGIHYIEDLRHKEPDIELPQEQTVDVEAEIIEEPMKQQLSLEEIIEKEATAEVEILQSSLNDDSTAVDETLLGTKQKDTHNLIEELFEIDDETSNEIEVLHPEIASEAVPLETVEEINATTEDTIIADAPAEVELEAQFDAELEAVAEAKKILSEKIVPETPVIEKTLLEAKVPDEVITLDIFKEEILKNEKNTPTESITVSLPKEIVLPSEEKIEESIEEKIEEKIEESIEESIEEKIEETTTTYSEPLMTDAELEAVIQAQFDSQFELKTPVSELLDTTESNETEEEKSAHEKAESESIDQVVATVPFVEEEEVQTVLEKILIESESTEVPDILAAQEAASTTEIPTNKDNSVQTSPLVQEKLVHAKALIDAGSLQEGMAIYEDIIAAHPQNTEVRLLYASNLAKRVHDFGKAFIELGKVLDINPQDADAYYMLGDISENHQDYILAKNYYEKTLSIDTEYPNVNYKIGRILSNHYVDQQKNAAKYFSKAIKQNKRHVDARYQYASLLNAHFGNYSEAIKQYKKTLKLNPLHPFAAYDLALLYHRLYETKKATEYYQLACKNNPDFKTDQNDAVFIDLDLGELANLSPIEAFEKGLQFERDPSETSNSAEKTPTPNATKVVIVTGATSGIGKATAEKFAQNGYYLILTGRREERLAELKETFEQQYNTQVQTLAFDVRDADSVKHFVTNLPEEWKNIDILINNAGLAKGFGPIHEGDIADWEIMIDTNIKGLLYMTRAVAPYMVKRQSGLIVNLCSTAGHEVYPNGNVYCATKFAVDALTKAMRLDLYKYNIKVSQISPAHVEQTEFSLVRFEGDAERAKIYNDFIPLNSADVADTIYFMATRPDHVNIRDIILAGNQQASSTDIHRSGRGGAEEEE